MFFYRNCEVVFFELSRHCGLQTAGFRVLYKGSSASTLSPLPGETSELTRFAGVQKEQKEGLPVLDFLSHWRAAHNFLYISTKRRLQWVEVGRPSSETESPALVDNDFCYFYTPTNRGRSVLSTGRGQSLVELQPLQSTLFYKSKRFERKTHWLKNGSVLVFTYFLIKNSDQPRY